MARIVLLSILFISLSVHGQQHNRRSMSELGVMFGGMYYIGDLNSYGHFKNTQLSGGIIYRYNVHSRMSIRANALIGSVKADDADSKVSLYQNRNLNFESNIYEFSGGVEFNYFPFQLGHDRYKGTAYLLAEIGLFYMNPTTQYNGNTIELQALGTEGQGTSLNSKKYYSKTQLTIPLGIGVKLSLGENASINFEYGLRKTFTDYLDDVKSSRYLNPIELAEAASPLTANLANRSLDGSRFGRRGNPNTKDWYAFAGVMFTFRLGQPNKCYNH